MNNLDRHLFKFQSQLLILNLQLAEVEEKPKRSGKFETTYKNKSGKEIIVDRSSDGKFASKVGNSASENLGKLLPPAIEPEADNAVREELNKIDAEAKNSLFANTGNTPGVAEGVKNTSIEEVIKGEKDAFSNAFDFMQSQMNLAAKTVSEHKKELAIGAAAVACFAATSILTMAAGIAVRSLIADTVVELVAGRGLSEATKTALTQLSADRVKAGLKKPIIATLLGFKIGNKIVNEIQKQLSSLPDKPNLREG